MMGKALAHRPRRRCRQNRRLRRVQAISPPGAEARRGRHRLAQGGRGAGPQAVQVERARGALACRAEGRARRFRSLGRVSGDARDESSRAGRSGGGAAVLGRVPGGREERREARRRPPARPLSRRQPETSAPRRGREVDAIDEAGEGHPRSRSSKAQLHDRQCWHRIRGRGHHHGTLGASIAPAPRSRRLRPRRRPQRRRL